MELLGQSGAQLLIKRFSRSRSFYIPSISEPAFAPFASNTGLGDAAKILANEYGGQWAALTRLCPMAAEVMKLHREQIAAVEIARRLDLTDRYVNAVIAGKD